MDAKDFDNEQVATTDRARQQQAVEAFVEFARQSSISSGIPRQRSMSFQQSPLLARHSARQGPLMLSGQRRPTHVGEPPSPLLSPSAISPDCEEVEGEQEVFVQASSRRRSYSDSEPFPQTPDPVAFQVRPSLPKQRKSFYD